VANLNAICFIIFFVVKLRKEEIIFSHSSLPSPNETGGSLLSSLHSLWKQYRMYILDALLAPFPPCWELSFGATLDDLHFEFSCIFSMCQSPKRTMDDFQPLLSVHWKSFIKLLRQLYAVFPPSRPFENILNHISQLLHIDHCSPFLMAWKNWLRPQPMHCVRLCNIYHKLITLDALFVDWISTANAVPASPLPPASQAPLKKSSFDSTSRQLHEMRATVADALATINCLNLSPIGFFLPPDGIRSFSIFTYDSNPSEPFSFGDTDKLLGALDRVGVIVHERLPLVTGNNVYKTSALRYFWPMGDHHTLRHESFLVQELLSLYARHFCFPEGRGCVDIAALRTTRDRLEHFISFICQHSSHSPQRYAHWISLLWLFEHMDSEKDTNRIGSFEPCFRALLSDMLFYREWSTWKNTFNVSLFGHSSSFRERRESLVHCNLDTSVLGPPIILQPLHVYISLEAYSDMNEVPLKNYEKKCRILAHLRKLFNDFQKNLSSAFDYIMGEWRVVALQLLIFFHAFKEGFTGEAYTQLQNYLLPFVFPCPKNSLPNFSRIEEQLASIAQKSCTLPWFNAIHRTLLLPILKALFAWTQSNYSMEELGKELGKAKVYFALLQLFALKPSTDVDPVRVYLCKLSSKERRAGALRSEKDLRKRQEMVLRGGSCNATIINLEKREKLISEKCSKLKKNVFVRPETPTFRTLINTLESYFLTLGSAESNLLLLHELLAPRMGHEATEQKELLWQDSQEQFVSRLVDFHQHVDITRPLAVATLQLKSGMRLVKYFRKIPGSKELSGVIKALLALPCASLITRGRTSPSHIEKSCVSSKLRIRFLKVLLFRALHSFRFFSDSLRLISSFPAPIDNICLKVINETYEIFESLYCFWKEYENFKRMKRANEQALFKLKNKSFILESEEALEMKEFHKKFPSYRNVYSEFLSVPTEDEDAESLHDHEDVEKESTECDALVITERDIVFICQSYCLFSTAFYNSFYLGRHDDIFACLNFEDLIKEGCMLAYHLIKDSFSSDVPCLHDKQSVSPAYSVHLIMIHNYINSTEMTCGKPLLLEPPRSFYETANRTEALKLLPILKKFKKTVCLLLSQWPDHPSLCQILSLIGRILSHNLSSPLMKFLTGLEILLQKAHEWEEYASKDVSLSIHINAISQIILHWRQLEMHDWPLALDHKLFEFERASMRLFFDVYEAVQHGVRGEGSVDLSAVFYWLNEV
jgi:uncharacterized protein YutD